MSGVAAAIATPTSSANETGQNHHQPHPPGQSQPLEQQPVPALSGIDLSETTDGNPLEQVVEDAAHPVNYGESSLYYDASTMASLNRLSAVEGKTPWLTSILYIPELQAAIARFRAYTPPPFPLWDRLPVRRRAAVLLLLYADRRGDLRIVITMRAASLRNFSGHAAFPGGKADSEDETPFQIARREAYEEIGLPMDDSKLPKPFRLEQLCYLPPILARTHLVVRPCVAFLHADRRDPGEAAPAVEDVMIPRLDAREVAAVFTAPFYNFLKLHDLPPPPGEVLPEGHWYDGRWIEFKSHPWRVHNFYVPVTNQVVAKPKARRNSIQDAMAEQLEEEEQTEGRFKVWGMTGRVLIDAARIGYEETPEMEHNEDYGDTDIIIEAEREGSLETEKSGEGDGNAAKM